MVKHANRFERAEWDRVNRFRSTVEVAGVTRHARTRLKERHIFEDGWDYSDFERCLHDETCGDVIELRIDSDVRILVRSKYAKHGRDLVFSINANGYLVTVYTNPHNEHYKMAGGWA